MRRRSKGSRRTSRQLNLPETSISKLGKDFGDMTGDAFHSAYRSGFSIKNMYKKKRWSMCNIKLKPGSTNIIKENTKENVDAFHRGLRKPWSRGTNSRRVRRRRR